MRWALVLAVVASEEAAFRDATRLIDQGRYQEAADAFVASADRAPTDPWADDAVAEAARLYEERLRDPVKAAELYERILRDYPSSRLALRAQRRAAALRASLGPENRDAVPLAELQDILQGYAGRPRRESIARVERLLREHPDFTDAPRAAFWLGEQRRKEGEVEAARRAYGQVVERWPTSEWTPRAHKALGDLHLFAGDFDEAERAYRRVAASGDPADARIAEEALEALATARQRAKLALLAWAVLGAFLLLHFAAARRLAGSAWAAARALARPPVEVLYFAPVAALFVAAALTENWAIAHAVELVCAGALVVVWLTGGSLELVRARRGVLRLAHVGLAAGGAVVAIAALSWLALTREHLLDMLFVG